MAKQDKNNRKGTLGDFIYYQWKGKQCIRAKPYKVVRTEASVKSGLNFGKASRIGSKIRDLIKLINPGKNDIQVMFRFTGALNKFISWNEKQIPLPDDLQSGLPFLKDFQFNDQADLSNMHFLKVSATLTEPGNLEIRLPAFRPKLSLPYFTLANKIVCKMILTGTDLDEGEAETYGSAEIDIPMNNEEFQPPELSMRTATGKGKLMMLIMALQYFDGTRDAPTLLPDKKKWPCGIVLSYFS